MLRILILIFVFAGRVEATAATPFTTAELTDVILTLKQITENAFTTYGGITPPSSNPADNTLNVLLTDISDGEEYENALESYFALYDQIRIQGLSDINRISNFGNVIHMDAHSYDPRTPRPSLGAALTNETTRTALANQKVFYQGYAGALMQLMQFQRINPYTTAEEKALLDQGILFEDDRWITDALKLFAAWRFSRSGADPLAPSPGIRITTNTISVADPVMDTSLGLEAPVDFLYLLHYPANTPYPSMMLREYGSIGHIATPATLSTEQTVQLKAARGLGFAFFLYLWEQLTYEGRQRAQSVNNLGDQFINALLSTGKVRTVTGTRLMGISDPANPQDEFCPASGNIPSRVCSIDRILRTAPIQSSRCTATTQRSCFDDFFMDMLTALFVDRQEAAGSSNLSPYEFRSLNLADMDTFNSTNVPGLSLGARRGLDWSLAQQLTDSFVPGSSGGDESTSATVSVSGITLSTYSPAYVSLTNQNSKADVDYLFADPGDQASDGSVDCKPLTYSSRLLLGTTVQSTTECPPNKPVTVYMVPKAVSAGSVSTGTVIFAGRRSGSVQFQASRVSTGQSAPLPQARSRIRMAISSGVVRYADKVPYTQVDAGDPRAIQQSRHAFQSLDFTQSGNDSAVYKSITAVLVDRREIIATGAQPITLQLWVDQNFLPSVSSGGGSSSGEVNQNPVTGTSGILQALEVNANTFTQAREVLRSVRVSGRTTLTVRLQNFSEKPVRLSFLPCTGTNECGGLPADFFRFECDNDTLTALPDCAQFSSLNQERTIEPFQTVVLPLRNKGLEDAVLMSFIRPSLGTASTESNPETGGGGSGCFIATTSFGNLDHPVVRVYTWIRDEILARTSSGRAFIAWYYRHSPAMARTLHTEQELRRISAFFLQLLLVLGFGLSGFSLLKLANFFNQRFRRTQTF